MFELDYDDNIYVDENKILLMNGEELKKYLDEIDEKFDDEYNDNTFEKNLYLKQLFIMICSSGNTMQYNLIKKYRNWNDYKSIDALEKCLLNSHEELYQKIVLENIINVYEINGGANTSNQFDYIDEIDKELLNLLSGCIRYGNLNMIQWFYSLDKLFGKLSIGLEGSWIEINNFVLACQSNKIDIAKWLLNHINISYLVNESCFVISNSCMSGNIELIKWLFDLLGSTEVQIDIIHNDMFYKSSECDLEFTQWIYNLVPHNNNIQEESFIENIIGACRNNLFDKAKWLYELKPMYWNKITFEKLFIEALDIGICQWILQIKPEFNIRFNNDSSFINGYLKKKYEFSKWLLEVDNSIDVKVQNNIAIKYCIKYENLQEAIWLLNYDLC